MDDYFGVHLNTMAEVFKDINDDKLQVWSRKILEETTSRLIKIKKYIRYGFFLIIPILNFEVQKSKTCYFVNKLVMVLYSEVFFFYGVEEFNFWQITRGWVFFKWGRLT
jgi:hypothetical protein